MEKLMRIAFAGAGDHIVRAHAKHLKARHDCVIAGVFDPGKTDALGDPLFPQYADLDEMLANPDIDAVMIGSPDRFHLQQLAASVKAGKHVFCEKPMCNSLEEFETLKEVFQEAHDKGLVVTSCHPRRFDPPYVWVKDNIDDLIGQYGQPLEIKLDFTYHKPSKTGVHGGSMLQDHMNHEFDFMNHVFDLRPCTAVKLHDEEDRYHVSGVRDDGLTFSFGGTRRLDSHTYAESIEIRFDRATVHLDTYNPARSFIYDQENPRGPHLPIIHGPTDYDLRFSKINENWVKTMLGEAENYLTAEQMIANSYMSVAFAQPGQQVVAYPPSATL